MVNNESHLLYSALCYEEGHSRRTQHILKVYALAKLLGEREKVSAEEQQILQAAAILHDIAIKYCKDNCGNTDQESQKKEAPKLVRHFLQEAGYLPSLVPQITELVVKHHDYDAPRSRMLQLLMEADLIVNCYESCPEPRRLREIQEIFETVSGKELLRLCIKGKEVRGEYL